MKKAFSQQGFTLIEALLYIFLFSIIIGGGMVGAYGIVQGSDRTSAKTIVEQEGTFLLRKISWALNGADEVSTDGVQLTVEYPTGPGDDITFTLNTTTAAVEINNTPLTSANVKITSLTFVRTPPAGEKPPAITTSFTATGTTGIDQTFETTKYLR